MSEELKEMVRERYGRAARQAAAGKAGCCGSGIAASLPEPGPSGACCGTESASSRRDPITSDLYTPSETATLPAAAVQASLGCGNPTALVTLEKGQTVLDLGSGGGIDVLLSARRVGPEGKVYGLDMTDEMLALARENARSAGATNVEFLKGEMEEIPLPDASVDVIISNCVINLSPEKDRVLKEARRVLRPGGRFAVSDIVRRGEMPEAIRRSGELWCGCVAGALSEDEYRTSLEAAGFTEVSIEPTRVYRVEDARELLAEAGIDADAVAPQLDGRFMSAFIRARAPLA